MRRREFMALLGSSVAAWPPAARAQQLDLFRRVGILISGAETDPEMQARVATIRQRLDSLGWSEGRNLRIDIRFAEADPGPIENAADIEHVIASLAQSPNGGLVVLPDSTSIQHRDLVVALAARHRLPAVYAFRFWVVAGGLMSYGTEILEQYREAASYVDRILRGAKPAELPVQAPTKYETILNLETAKSLGLEVPPSLLVRADQVIE